MPTTAGLKKWVARPMGGEPRETAGLRPQTFLTAEVAMINRRRLPTGEVQVTFVLDEPRPVSVVGDFNDWDPYRHPLEPRCTGLRSAVVVASEGAVLRFRYLAESGEFFDDPDACAIEDDGLGGAHGVVLASISSGSVQ